MSKRSNREASFDLFAKNLSLYYPKYKDQFICPLCTNLFTREDLHSHPPKLSLAHAPPQAIDGKIVALACAKCDNMVGANMTGK
jgi:hypothetical protein